MGNFKSNNQRRFLFAMDKNSGIPQQKSQPNSLPTSRPPQMTLPPPAHNLGMMHQTPAYHPPKMGTINPTANPTIKNLPTAPKMPKFAKMKKYLKPTKEF